MQVIQLQISTQSLKVIILFSLFLFLNFLMIAKIAQVKMKENVFSEIRKIQVSTLYLYMTAPGWICKRRAFIM